MDGRTAERPDKLQSTVLGTDCVLQYITLRVKDPFLLLSGLSVH